LNWHQSIDGQKPRVKLGSVFYKDRLGRSHVEVQFLKRIYPYGLF